MTNLEKGAHLGASPEDFTARGPDLIRREEIVFRGKMLRRDKSIFSRKTQNNYIYWFMGVWIGASSEIRVSKTST